MRKWIYRTLSHLGTVTTVVDGDEIELESGTELYVASDVDARIAELEEALRLCHAVISGHDLNKQALADALQAIKALGL